MLQEIMGDDVETMHFTQLVEAKFGERHRGSAY